MEMDYLVMKKIGDGAQAGDWTPVVIARGLQEGGEEAAALQGYTGPGRYKATPWPAAVGSEFDLGAPGPPSAAPVTEEPASEPEPEPEEEEEEEGPLE